MPFASLDSLVGRHFAIEVLEGRDGKGARKWIPHEGDVAARCFGRPTMVARGLTVAKNCVYVDGKVLQNVKWNSSLHGITFGGGGYDGPVGQLTVDRNFTSFVGNMSSSPTSEIMTVRGLNTSTKYKTMRKKKDVDSSWEDFDELLMGTKWDELGILQDYYELGYEDVSSRTAATEVAGWDTTYEMFESAGGSMYPGTNSFRITTSLDFETFESHFTGWYKDKKDGEIEWDWKGTSYTPEDQKAIQDAHVALLQKKARPAPAPMPMSNGGLSEMDLNAISTLSPTEETEDGEIVYKDLAQEKTGEYIQKMLLYSLEGGNEQGDWIDQLYGGRPYLKSSLKEIQQKHKKWFEEEAIPNMGQLLHDCVTDPTYKETLAKIDEEKIQKNYEAFGESEDYMRASQDVYLEAYVDAVPQIKPYIENREYWGPEYEEMLTSEEFLNNWALQVSSDLYDNIKHTMYEQNVKLTLLHEEDSEVPHNVLSLMFSTILAVNIAEVMWDEEMRPFVEKSIRNLVEGTVDFQTEFLEQILEYQEIVDEMCKELGGRDNAVQMWVKFITRAHHWDALKDWNPSKLTKIAEEIAEETAEKGLKKSVLKWGGKFGEAMKAIGYGAFGGYLLYLAFDEESRNIITDISLTLIGGAALLEGTAVLTSSKLGKWIFKKVTVADGSLSKALTSFTKWFGEEGLDEASKMAKILGKNKAKFFATRLGPALSVLGVTLAGMALKTALAHGDVPSIIFESLNLALEISGVIFIGLEMYGFAWAGPAGLAVAIAGLLVAFFQIVWGLFDRPDPPPDPIEEFVNGPLAENGFTLDSVSNKKNN